jgi:hypothetical protein
MRIADAINTVIRSIREAQVCRDLYDMVTTLSPRGLGFCQEVHLLSIALRAIIFVIERDVHDRVYVSWKWQCSTLRG